MGHWWLNSKKGAPFTIHHTAFWEGRGMFVCENRKIQTVPHANSAIFPIHPTHMRQTSPEYYIQLTVANTVWYLTNINRIVSLCFSWARNILITRQNQLWGNVPICYNR